MQSQSIVYFIFYFITVMQMYIPITSKDQNFVKRLICYITQLKYQVSGHD